MKPKTDHWTVVLAGQWNVRIFSPDWVGRVLFDDKDVQIEVGIGVQSVRYMAQDLVIIPADTTIVIGIKRIDDEMLERAEAMASKILSLLPHTPVSAFGINFAYSIDKPTQALTSLFGLSDLNGLSDSSCDVRRTEILRSLNLKERVLNLRHVLVGGCFESHLNFHQDVGSTKDAIEKLKGNAFACKKIGNDLLRDVYNLEIQSQSGEEVHVHQ